MAPSSLSTCATDEATPNWTLEEAVLYPSRPYINRLNTFLADRAADDVTVKFVFDPALTPDAPPDPVHIHISRLEWADGPLRALTQHAFREQKTGTVALSAEDTPLTFRLLRDFLYGKQVALAALALPDVLDAMRASHRWLLLDLFRGLAHFVEDCGLLATPVDVLAAAATFALPDIPHVVLVYFWERVGAGFWFFTMRPSSSVDGTSCKEECSSLSECENSAATEGEEDSNVFGSVDCACGNEDGINRGDASITPSVSFEGSAEEPVRGSGRGLMFSSVNGEGAIEERFCPRFPGLWPLAISHGLVRVALHNILYHGGHTYAYDCLNLVMQYLEPRIKDDEEVCDLIAQLRLDPHNFGRYLSLSSLDGVCSTRAIRLLAKTLISGRIPRQEVRHSWLLNLHDEEDFMKTFLFTPENRVNAQNGMRDEGSILRSQADKRAHDSRTQKRGRHVNKYDVLMHGAVQFTLSVESAPGEVLTCTLVWCAGSLLESLDDTLHVSLQVLDDRCMCAVNNCARSAQRARWLLRGSAHKPVCEGGEIVMCCGVEALRAYLGAHGECCEVTLSLVVHLEEDGAW